MGMADFYLKINFKKQNYDEFETIYQSFINESIFRILDKEIESNFLSLECKFDNLIPSIIITFDNLYPFKDNIDSIETHGIVKDLLTNSSTHPHGIKVRLTDGQVGRVCETFPQ